jgi:hypothetical protein
MPTTIIPLEFEGAKPMTKEMAGYDCRICMVLQRSPVDESAYIFRTKKDERLDNGGHMIDYCDILEGEQTICLPDHNYAHADHDWAERIMYAERLQAILPADECVKLMVSQWAARPD